jgi:cell division protein FtsI (penicillin-binding protein 3)
MTGGGGAGRTSIPLISRWTRLRMLVLGATFGLFGLAIARRAIELQVGQAELLRERAEDQSFRQIELRPQRGRLLDRNGHELASTAELDSVSCNPRVLLSVVGGVKRLAAALQLEAPALERTLERSAEARRYFAWIKRQVTREESERVRALALPGVRLTGEPARIYPQKELGAAVLGHTNIDGKGVEGIEKAFDAYLRGIPTHLRGVKDGSGREMLLDGLVDSKSTAGRDLQLTLDTYLMHITQTALAGAVKHWSAKGGAAVVMDPRTGDVLAMASVPTYDANDPGDAVARGFTRNRAITDAYEPGSTMKTFTLASTLEAGRVSPGTTFDCQSGRPLLIGKTQIRDDHPEGVLTAAAVYQRSSNIGTVKIARLLGKQKLYDGLVRFGFGRRTGVGLEGERAGVLHPVHKWGEVHFANIAFGQGLTVTPLQMVAGFAAIANGGTYKPPRLALQVIDAEGRRQAVPPAEDATAERRVLSTETARTMLSIMRGVTGEQGTARRAAIPGYSVAGKTGTAQKVINGKYAAWVGSFIGVIPADDPKVVIGIVIDEPEPEHRGGIVAAPVFKQVAEAALRYLSVRPSEAVSKVDKPDKIDSAPAAEGSAPAESAEGAGPPAAMMVAEIGEGPGSDQPVWSDPEDFDDGLPALGDEDDAAADGPEVAGEGQASASVSAIVQVPRFVGMTVGEAIRAARQAGVELIPEGSGTAVTQSPGPGRRPRGAICRVSFRPGG